MFLIIVMGLEGLGPGPVGGLQVAETKVTGEAERDP